MTMTRFTGRSLQLWARAAGSAGLLAACLALPAQAQGSLDDATAKARFTITLARFVQWPAGNRADAGNPLNLCLVHGSAAVAQAFTQLNGQSVAGRRVAVHANPRVHTGCDLLFVDGSAGRNVIDTLSAGHAALTLGAVDGFLAQGGMVELANVDDALRFDVNLRALRLAHLGLSSQVLKLARQVQE